MYCTGSAYVQEGEDCRRERWRAREAESKGSASEREREHARAARGGAESSERPNTCAVRERSAAQRRAGQFARARGRRATSAPSSSANRGPYQTHPNFSRSLSLRKVDTHTTEARHYIGQTMGEEVRCEARAKAKKKAGLYSVNGFLASCACHSFFSSSVIPAHRRGG